MAEQKTIDQMTTAELGLLLNQCYQGLMQNQNNIVAINAELEKRKMEVPASAPA
jgi:hypothetical protein